jgi:hypothetical protein
MHEKRISKGESGAPVVRWLLTSLMVSPSGQQSQGSLYILLSTSDLYMHAADAIAGLDAKTFQQEAIFVPKSSFWSSSWNFCGAEPLEMVAAGFISWASSPRAELSVYCGCDGKEVDAIKGVGTTPCIIAPSP